MSKDGYTAETKLSIQKQIKLLELAEKELDRLLCFFQSTKTLKRNMSLDGETIKLLDIAELLEFTEAVVRRCSVKKLILEFRKIYRKGAVPESLF